MGEVIWIERVTRGGEVLSRERVERLPLVVGRGYQADLIVDDPAVAALHLRIGRDESGALVAEDLGSLNGLRLGDGPRVPRCVIDLPAGNTVLRIGDTRLRLRDSAHAVAAERPVTAAGRHGGWFALAFGLLLSGLLLTSFWLTQTGEPSISSALSGTGMLLLVGALWSGAWALCNRLFAGRTQFGRHLALAYGLLSLSALLGELLDISAFSLSLPSLPQYSYVVVWLSTGLLCLGHLRLIGRGHPRLKLAAVGGLTALGIGWGALAQSDAREHSGPAVVVQTLLPPAWRLAPAQSLDEFMSLSASLQAETDSARDEPPHDPSNDDL